MGALDLSVSKPTSESPAVGVARSHVEAWNNHDWEKARKGLAGDVHVTATTTQAYMGSSGTDLTGADNYMEGLKKFASLLVKGSARVAASIGDERNAILLVTAKATFGPGGTEVTFPQARLYQLNENGKIKAEQVIFCALA